MNDDSDKNSLWCGFCGKTKHQVSKLLSGIDDVYICDECVDLCGNALRKEKKKQTKAQKLKKIQNLYQSLTPREIHYHLDEHIIGQERAKKGVSVAIYNHCKRILNDFDVKIQKSNLLLLGPTGVGKTLMAQTLAEMLDVPFVITDATTLTESGYAGDDTETLISHLFKESDYDIDKTEIGIIYVDEIDKKAKRNDLVSLSRDVSGEGVQQSLLKLMEGTIVTVPNKPQSNPETVDIDTSNILFMVSGAFVGLDNLVLQRLGKSKIGFGEQRKDIENLWQEELQSSDLVQYGLIPEFLGRLPSINILNDLDKDDLIKVMTQPKNSLVKQYQALFLLDNIELEFNIRALDAVAEIAIEQNLGARGLRKILDNALIDIQYKLPEMKDKGVKKIIVTHETIINGREPQIIKGSI